MIIFEPYAMGNRMHYVRYIAAEALERGEPVKLVTFQGSLGHPSTLKLVEECKNVQTLIIPQKSEEYWRAKVNDPNFVKSKVNYHRMFIENYRKLSVGKDDIVFVPHLDYIYMACAVLGSTFGESVWSGIVFSPDYYSTYARIVAPKSKMNWLRKVLLNQLLENKRLRNLFTVNPVLFNDLNKSNSRYSQKMCYVPEPVEVVGEGDKSDARTRLSIPQDGKLILVYGELTPHKGIKALLSAVDNPVFPEDVNVLFAGPQDAHIKKLMASSLAEGLRKSGRLFMVDRFITGQDEYDVFKASNMVWAGYRGVYGRSEVIFQAGLMGLPILACGVGAIGYMTKKHNLGMTVKVSDSRDVADAVTALVQDTALASKYAKEGLELAKQHTRQAFASKICDKLGFD